MTVREDWQNLRDRITGLEATIEIMHGSLMKREEEIERLKDDRLAGERLLRDYRKEKTDLRTRCDTLEYDNRGLLEKIAQLDDALDKRNQTIANLEDDVAAADRMRTRAERMAMQYEERIKALETVTHEFESTLESSYTRERKLETQLAEVLGRLAHTAPHATELEAQVNTLGRRVTTLVDDQGRMAEMLAKHTKQIADMSKHVLRLDERITVHNADDTRHNG